MSWIELPLTNYKVSKIILMCKYLSVISCLLSDKIKKIEINNADIKLNATNPNTQVQCLHSQKSDSKIAHYRSQDALYGRGRPRPYNRLIFDFTNLRHLLYYIHCRNTL